MGMYEQSVEMALQYGKSSNDWEMKLANEIAKKPTDIDERKVLTKQIVDFLVSEKKIRLAMETVQKCQDLLSIEDIIKDLPDEMHIESIADELCSSLEQSNRKVSMLREQMNITKETTERIKKENRELDDKKYVLPEDSSCIISKLPLKGRHFYQFIDGSSFIDQPLYDYVKHTPLPSDINEEVTELVTKMKEGTEEVEKLESRKRIEDILISEHPFYSQYFIQSISQPFMQNVDEAEKLSWKL